MGEEYKEIYYRLAENKSVESAERRVIGSITEEKLNDLLDRWRKTEILNDHITVLERGIGRYINEDYICSINCVWPRIEGILAEFFEKQDHPSQTQSIENIESLISEISPQTYLPNQFKNYLKDYYFADFDVGEGELDLSRNTISHGIAKPEDFDKKRALIGILIVDQLVYYHNLYKSK